MKDTHMRDITRYPYEDSTLSIDQRVADLAARLTLEDKAALLFHSEAPFIDPDGNDQWGRPGAGVLLRERGITHILIQGSPRHGRELAEWHNRVQEIALEHPLRIPVTFSSDPRHSVTENPLTSNAAGAFSRWPEALGMAAIGSDDLAREQGDVVRREYLAAGIRVALHPQVDLATEPRWARIAQTFGEDADLTSRMSVAYTTGLQGPSIDSGSVVAMGKHFPGGGPQRDGLDPHFSDGREQVYPGGRFEYHLKPFVALIEAGISQMMPYYGMPVGTEWEEVGFAFSKGVITGLLRDRLGFDGIVCTDFGVITGMGDFFPAKAWGVEHLSRQERVARLLNAGVDQFGGEKDVDVLLGALSAGLVDQQQLDGPVRRLLREKFRLGLFDEARTVDPESADAIIGSAENRTLGVRAQQRSLVLLKNDARETAPMLPLPRGLRVYAEGIEPDAFEGFATVVTDLAEADVAVIRTTAPDYADPARHFLGSMHKGSLEFREEDRDRIEGIASTVPTVLDVYLDRPAVLTDVLSARAVLASFGTDDRPFVGVLFGDAGPEGALPFDLPRSMTAVMESRSDVPFDTENPLFRFGHGLRYSE
jgi:beta-glucosidase